MGFHLLHPMLVHFAVAFLVAGAMGEAAGIAAGRPALERFSGKLVLIGTAALLPTVASGFLAGNLIHLPAGAEALYELHEKLGLAALGAFLGLALWKAWGRGTVPAGQRTAYAAALVLAAALVAWQAWLGGAMVYGAGVGVTPSGTAP